MLNFWELGKGNLAVSKAFEHPLSYFDNVQEEMMRHILLLSSFVEEETQGGEVTCLQSLAG